LVKLREECSANFQIEVDGGVGLDNIKLISEAGCDVFVAGNSIFSSNNITAATVELKNMLLTENSEIRVQK
ncbi:MAG: ribulose-phosphate 3-epimerase, partial [Bacteroidota bacterium]